ncbi:hypothetical protein Tco_0638130 [Tanacetum coccineum]
MPFGAMHAGSSLLTCIIKEVYYAFRCYARWLVSFDLQSSKRYIMPFGAMHAGSSLLTCNHQRGDQPPETSSSHATTQDSKDSLEGTNRNEGNQVQTLHDSPLSGGHTSDRAEDSVNRLSMTKRFGKESVSKQGRKKSKPESTLDDSTVFDDQDADHGMEYMETEEAEMRRQSVKTKEYQSSTARPDIDAARQEDSAVEPRTPPITTSIFDDEDITMARYMI